MKHCFSAILMIALFFIASCSKKDSLSTEEPPQESLNASSADNSALYSFPSTHKWYDIIQSFKVQDNNWMPLSNTATLFVGSSSIFQWEDSLLKKSFPNTSNIIKRGLGGALLQDIFYNTDALVDKYKPKNIILYVGDNDIHIGRTKEEMMSWMTKLYTKLRNSNPHAQIIVLTIKPSISLWEKHTLMESINSEWKKYIVAQPKSAFVDVYSPMLKDGVPNPQYFKSDGIHMTKTGYDVWVSQIKKSTSIK